MGGLNRLVQIPRSAPFKLSGGLFSKRAGEASNYFVDRAYVSESQPPHDFAAETGRDHNRRSSGL